MGKVELRVSAQGDGGGCERLVAWGKKKIVAIVAVARKLLVVMVTLMRHKRTFDPEWTARHTRPA